ncbi:MAG: metallophosphatase family protein [Anaerolineae bacterium]|nr:metallophosphatase family protein [Anaerolineae bacterium]MCI0607439.1 metallophosphatase family protein [Anaerolineae bacterium]
MKIAVISDMHGNNLAFETVLADIKQKAIEQTICLGDAIQGGPQPAEVAQNLRALNCPVVMGNADVWLLSGTETGDEGIPPERLKKMGEIRLWSLSQLTDADRAFIANFQPTITIPLEGNLKLLCFHGSPASFDDIILPAAPLEEFHKFLGTYSDQILTGGHTHAQQIRRNGDLFFFNPGSVGFAYSHYQSDGQFHADPWAEYAILTVENGQTSLEFRRIPFDVQELIRTYRESGRPFAEEAIAQYQK